MEAQKGIRCLTKQLAIGEKLLISSDSVQIILQIRHRVSTEDDLLALTFKVAVQPSEGKALGLSQELFNVVMFHIPERKAKNR